MTRLLNRYLDKVPKDAISIERPSKWGNPFKISKDLSRAQCIVEYHKWILNQPDLLNSLHELEGKDLVCCCKPNLCHGDVLISLLNRNLDKYRVTKND